MWRTCDAVNADRAAQFGLIRTAAGYGDARDTVMIVEIVSKPQCVSGHARLSHQWVVYVIGHAWLPESGHQSAVV